MENPIWFNFGKLEGDEGGRKCCLACVQATDCISLSLETHFPSQLLGVCHCRNGGAEMGAAREGAQLRACFFVFSSTLSPEVPYLRGSWRLRWSWLWDNQTAV